MKILLFDKYFRTMNFIKMHVSVYVKKIFFNYHIGLHLNLGNVIAKDYEHLWNTVSKLVRKFDVGKPFPLRMTKLHFLEKNPLPIKGKKFLN